MDIIITDGSIWTWWILAAALFIAELLLPGVFLIWLGVAAAMVGLINFFVPMPWQIEVLLFGVFSIGVIAIANPWMKRRQVMKSDRPNLNQRMFDYVGKRYMLEQPIKQGRGQLRIEDTYWEIVGPELPEGSWVKVTGVDGSRLIVESG